MGYNWVNEDPYEFRPTTGSGRTCRFKTYRFKTYRFKERCES